MLFFRDAIILLAIQSLKCCAVAKIAITMKVIKVGVRLKHNHETIAEIETKSLKTFHLCSIRGIYAQYSKPYKVSGKSI